MRIQGEGPGASKGKESSKRTDGGGGGEGRDGDGDLCKRLEVELFCRNNLTTACSDKEGTVRTAYYAVNDLSEA